MYVDSYVEAVKKERSIFLSASESDHSNQLGKVDNLLSRNARYPLQDVYNRVVEFQNIQIKTVPNYPI